MRRYNHYVSKMLQNGYIGIKSQDLSADTIQNSYLIFFVRYLVDRERISTFAALEPPSLLTMLKSGVVLFLIPMPIAFEKHFTPVEDIVDILCCRGLNIDNYDEALHLLTNIGYYRFSAYLYPLLETPKCNHQFKTNSSFNNALSLYCFDKQLRMLIFSEIESIEIAFRSVLANRIADKTGDIFWMTNASMYKDENRFANTMLLLNKELKVSKEDFIKHG